MAWNNFLDFFFQIVIPAYFTKHFYNSENDFLGSPHSVESNNEFKLCDLSDTLLYILDAANAWEVGTSYKRIEFVCLLDR